MGIGLSFFKGIGLDFIEEGVDEKLELLLFHDDELVPVLL